MDDDIMNPSKFREIIRNDGRTTQREILDAFVNRRRLQGVGVDTGDVMIDFEKVPVLVNAKQFDAMQLRRRVRAAMERTRIAAGRSKDNRRMGQFKSLQKHLHATRRPRSQGAFIATRIKEEPSLCN